MVCKQQGKGLQCGEGYPHFWDEAVVGRTWKSDNGGLYGIPEKGGRDLYLGEGR